MIRGICCLRAGVPGLSENIRVRSILGRYLEHSRIYRFAHGDVDDEPLYLIGSADLMPRNLDRRVEVLVPIEHPKHRDWLDQVIDFPLADDIVRWELQPDDTLGAVRPGRRVRARTPRSGSTAGSSSARPQSASADRRRSAAHSPARRLVVHRPFTDARGCASPALPTVRAGAAIHSSQTRLQSTRTELHSVNTSTLRRRAFAGGARRRPRARRMR